MRNYVDIEEQVLDILQTWATANLVRAGYRAPVVELSLDTCLGTIPTDTASWEELNLDIEQRLPGIKIDEALARKWKTAGDVMMSVRTNIEAMPVKRQEWFGTLTCGEMIWNEPSELTL